MKLNLLPSSPLAPISTTLSEEQHAFVYAPIEPGSPNLFCAAVAGSGKTFALLQRMLRIQHERPKDSILLLAYNARIAAELRHKAKLLGITNAKIVTVHAAAKQHLESTIPNLEIDKLKGWDLARELSIPFKQIEPILGLVEIAIDSGIEFDSNITLSALAQHHNLCNSPSQIEAAGRLLARYIISRREGRKARTRHLRRSINFADLIPLAIQSGSLPLYDHVLLDECQDTNATRLAFALGSLKLYGIFAAVGDDYQAIFGFSGADAFATQAIIDKTSPVLHRLTYSRRCASSIVASVTHINPHIRALPSAPAGTVNRITSAYFSITSLSPDSAVLCRNNAPLISLLVQCVRNQIPCRFEGSEIGEDFKRLILKLATPTTPSSALIPLLEEHYRTKSATLSDYRAEQLYDKIQCIILLSQLSNSTAGVLTKIAALFSDFNPDAPPCITFSSIHKSKGLEWPNVYIFGENKYQPSKFAVRPWQIDQERNLIYVARTRAILNLTLVSV